MLRKLKKVFALLHQARKFRTKFVAKKHKIVGDAFISSTVFGNFVAVELMKVDISYQYIGKEYGRKSRKMKKTNLSHRICCPECNRTTRLRYYEDTVLLRFPLYCYKCKKEIRIDLIDNKIYKSLEPDT